MRRPPVNDHERVLDFAENLKRKNYISMIMKEEIINWYIEKASKLVIEALKKNGFNAYFVRSKEEALNKVLELVPEGAKIGIGGSTTIRELKIADVLAEKGYKVFRHDIPGLSPEEQFRMRREELLTDVFLASANAITLDGKIVNMDGTGNRVAAMAFGPKKVILVAGVNKVVKDLESAIWRIKNVVAPMNAKRLKRNVPCVENGFCSECDMPDRICNVLLILEKKPSLTEYHIILVGEELGF